MPDLDDRLKESLADVAKALENFEAVAIQCEFRDNNKHCTFEDYPNKDNVVGVLDCTPCLYAWCPRAHAK